MEGWLSPANPRPALRAAALLLQAVVLTASLGMPVRADAGAMSTGPEMTCAEFSAMDTDGQMQAMATMAAAPDAMASDAMATEATTAGAMANEGAMADEDHLKAAVAACDGHADMMAADAMHTAVAH
ncbi:MAG: hypothetical protein NTV73_00745 [Hyphomicrobiales bacterium]|nr:hypothetical protein [Hyphomicrobiales bacterium]